jgi:hypothetical protein
MNLNYKIGDIALIKLTVLAGAFLLVSVWPGLANWVTNTNWIWFLVATILLAIKPMITTFKK